MVIHVVAVGRIRAKSLQEICDDYAARIRRHYRLEIHEVPDVRGRKRPPREVQRAEGQALLRTISGPARRYALSRHGEGLTSAQVSEWLGEWQREARDVALFVGGAHGLDEAVVAACDATVSLSALTLPHELARLVLLEQLYRAGTMLRGEPYHKGTSRS